MTPAQLKAVENGDIENFIIAATRGGIEAQEAAGQKSLVADQTLPKECPRSELEKLGFIFAENADDIFISVKFPEGWSKKATDHSMWSSLLDEKNRKRGSIFYKAAFYDRSAHMTLDRRFSVRQNYDIDNGVQYQVFDCDNYIFETNKIECEKHSDKYWEAQDTAKLEAEAYLNERHPEWHDVSAHWD